MSLNYFFLQLFATFFATFFKKNVAFQKNVSQKNDKMTQKWTQNDFFYKNEYTNIYKTNNGFSILLKLLF